MAFRISGIFIGAWAFLVPFWAPWAPPAAAEGLQGPLWALFWLPVRARELGAF